MFSENRWVRGKIFFATLFYIGIFAIHTVHAQIPENTGNPITPDVQQLLQNTSQSASDLYQKIKSTKLPNVDLSGIPGLNAAAQDIRETAQNPEGASTWLVGMAHWLKTALEAIWQWIAAQLNINLGGLVQKAMDFILWILNQGIAFVMWIVGKL